MGFYNFYKRFIYRFSTIIISLINLLKGIEKGRKIESFNLTVDRK
jgi:hypothetical protein